MRVFKTRPFARWARHEGITDRALREAVVEIEAGLVDADLGSGLYKKRVARRGGGKSGGYRILLACRRGERIVFMTGFAKNERDNIDSRDLSFLKSYATDLLGLSGDEVADLVADRELVEIDHAETFDS